MRARCLALVVLTSSLLALPGWTLAATALRTAPVQAEAGAGQGAVLDAVVEAARQTVVAAQVPGAVVALGVKAGDAVKAGQWLLRLDARGAQAGTELSQAQLEAARAQATQAQREQQRQQALFDKQYVSQAAVERSQAALDAARAQVRALEAQLSAARTQAGYHSVLAPYAGVVSELPVSLGDLAMPGRPLLTLFDPASLRLSAQVPESLAAALAGKGPQGAVQVQIEGLAPFAAGALQWLPAVDPASHSRTLRLALPAAQAQGLAPGRFARISLPGVVAAGAPARLFVPREAVLRRAELQAVYVVPAEGPPRLRQVRLGEVRGEQIEVLSGLRAGEAVALDPQAAAQVR